VVEIDKRVRRPEFLAHLLASDHIAGALEKQGEHLERLLLEAKLPTVLAQLGRREIKLEDAKARNSARAMAWESWHSK
jgi:hypothetical protein